jgi:S1-C subfamily serine protease
MKRGWLIGLLLSLVAVAPAQVMPTEVRRATLASVVQVLAYSDEQSIGFGSGVIVSEFGHVISNWHVVEREGRRSHRNLFVVLGDPDRPELAPERYFRAEVVGANHDLDLVVLQMVSDEQGRPLDAALRFPAAPIVASSSALLGDPVFIFGYPWIAGATVTLTAGTISGFVGENFVESGRAWIKTDARLQPGNSGGGAFDGEGNLLGIATGLLVSENQRQEFLRPADLFAEVLARAIPNFKLVGPLPQLAAPPAVRDLAPAPRPPPSSPAPTPPTPTERGAERVAADIDGEISTDSDWYFRGRYAEGHPLTLEIGTEVHIDLSSLDFDAYLVVLNPEGNVVVNIDDTPGRGTDVATSFVARTRGSYLVIATTAFRDEFGRYRLQLATTAPQPVTAANPPANAPAVGGAPAGNLSGLWQGELRDASGRAGLVVSIRTFGEVLDGSYRLNYGDLAVTGDFSGLWRDGVAQVLLIPSDPNLCTLIAFARSDGDALSGTYEGESCVGDVRGTLHLRRY